MSNNNTISDNLIRLNSAKTAIANAITAKGGTVNTGDGFEDFPDDIASIDTGGGTTFESNNIRCKPSLKKQFMDAPSWRATNIANQGGSISNLEGKYVWTDGNIWYHTYAYKGTAYYAEYYKSLNMWVTRNISPANVGSDGAYCWTDGENIYYSYGTTQQVYDKTKGAYVNKTWNGLTSFYGSSIWSDGENIYTGSYVLDKSTSTWNPKTWTGLTSVGGQSVWTDGENIYYSSGSSGQYVLDKSTSTWNVKTWEGIDTTYLYGSAIWTDGENIYSSYYRYVSSSTYFYYHHILNKSTGQWESKTWNGTTNFQGSDTLFDGDNVFLLRGSASGRYILDKSTSTWTTYTFNYASNTTGLSGGIWTDGDNIYCSNGTTQQIFNKEYNIFVNTQWNGLTSFYGYDIWTDGSNIYCSSGSSTQYVLNKSTSTWIAKTWNGLTDFRGDYIWTDGTDIYYSNYSNQYVLDKATSTWITKTWSGLTSFTGASIWTDGDNIYYSGGSSTTQFVLDKDTSTWNSTTLIPSGISGSAVWTDGTHIILGKGRGTSGAPYGYFAWNKNLGTYTGIEMGNTDFYPSAVWTDGEYIYYNASDITAVTSTKVYRIEWNKYTISNATTSVPNGLQIINKQNT